MGDEDVDVVDEEVTDDEPDLPEGLRVCTVNEGLITEDEISLPPGVEDALKNLPTPVPDDFRTWADVRRYCNMFSDVLDDWQGIPVPLTELKLVLNPRHHLREGYPTFWAEVQQKKLGITVEPVSAEEQAIAEAAVAHADENGIAINDDGSVVFQVQARPTDAGIQCSVADVDETQFTRNHWYNYRHNYEVWIIQEGEKITFTKTPISPDRCMQRLHLWLDTLAAIDAWDLDAEYNAREKLMGMLSEHQWRQYDLTGSFVEHSDKSDLFYLFRRLRPTVVISPHLGWKKDGTPRTGNTLVIGVLCMHSIGYYEHTWAGCLTPTDEVVAHLTYMRGDEAGYWGEANQHLPWAPEAGI